MICLPGERSTLFRSAARPRAALESFGLRRVSRRFRSWHVPVPLCYILECGTSPCRFGIFWIAASLAPLLITACPRTVSESRHVSCRFESPLPACSYHHPHTAKTSCKTLYHNVSTHIYKTRQSACLPSQTHPILTNTVPICSGIYSIHILSAFVHATKTYAHPP